ncbi:MAG TPA: hypothetical protein PKA60_01150 [Candidatus Paceibacterota bacterium]|nr:hypothetical protein [Candidatus Paceibacterota bacterium]
MINEIKQKNTRDLLAIFFTLVLILVFACVYFYEIGYEKAEFEIYSYLTNDSTINECDGNGCYIDLPKNDFFAGYIPCSENHYCIFEGKTEEQKLKDLEIEKIWENSIRENQLFDD